MDSIDLKDRLGLYFEDLTDLMFYFQDSYEEYSKEDLVFVISTIVQNVLGD